MIAKVCAIAVLCAGNARGAGEDGGVVDSTSVGRGRGFDRPVWVMLRSVAVPGWGQAKNGAWLKAALFAGAEGAFIAGIVDEGRLADAASRRAKEEPDLAIAWEGRAEDHRARRKDYIWWGAFTVLLSMGDAYVDAHLKGFKAEFRPDDAALLLSIEVRR